MNSTSSLYLAIALVTSGCPKDDCGSNLDRVQPLASPITMTGTPTRFTIGIRCTTGVTAVTATATDLHGEASPVEVITFTETGGALVELNTTLTGPHTITARFEPSGEQASVSTHVIRDRSAEPAAFHFTSSRRCQEVHVVRDVVACRSDSAIELFRDGRLVDSVEPGKLTSTGAVLWAVNESGAHRWAPTDAGLNGSHLLLDLRAALGRVVGTRADELVLAWPDKTLFALRSSPTGLHLASLGYERDDQLFEGLVMPTSGVVWLNLTDVCFAAPSEPKRCRPWAPRMLAADGDTLWFHDTSVNEVGFARFANGPTPISMQFLRPDQSVKNLLQFSLNGIPFSRLDEHLVAIDPEALRLDAWRGPPNWTNGGVSTRHVFFSVDDQYVVYAR